jgi:carboxymethylenebutenolidase
VLGVTTYLRDHFEAGTLTVTGADGDPIEAYAAHPVDRALSGGVVVIHHMPGYDEATKEISRRFAAWGWSAICANLHHRDAPGAAPDDASAASRAAGGVPDDRLVGDVGGAAAYLRGHPTGNGKVATIGFCSGGRQSVLAGCGLELDGVIDCYGAFVLSPPDPGMALRVTPLDDRLAGLSCPVLGLFGAEDSHPGRDEVAALDTRLSELGNDHEFHTFENAGHGFFAVDRPSYRQEAAVEGWRLVHGFLTRRLGEAAA